mgnify:CR=1 FL=1
MRILVWEPCIIGSQYKRLLILVVNYKSRVLCVLNAKSTQERLRISFHVEAQIFTCTQPSTARWADQERNDAKIRPLSQEKRMVGRRQEL